MHTLIEEVRVVQGLPSPSEARAIRIGARVSRRRLARELGVNEITVYRWEAGTSHPRGDNLIDYAKLLGALQQVVA